LAVGGVLDSTTTTTTTTKTDTATTTGTGKNQKTTTTTATTTATNTTTQPIQIRPGGIDTTAKTIQLNGTVVASAGVGVTKIGTTVTAVNTVTSRITVPNISSLGWEVGDRLQIGNTITGSTGTNITGRINSIQVNGSNFDIELQDLRDSANATLAALPSPGLVNAIVRLAAVKTPATIIDANLYPCFRPAPLQQKTDFNNRREGKNINILQLSLEGLTLWNRDGIVTKGTTNQSSATLTANAASGATTLNVNPEATAALNGMGLAVGNAIKIMPVDNSIAPGSYTISGIGAGSITLSTPLTTQFGVGSTIYLSADQKLFNRAPATDDTNTNQGNTPPDPRTYKELGLAATDQTDGGLAFYLTIDGNDSRFSTAKTNVSAYGFALTRGASLPGPLSVISDQAVYVQGDYNCNRQIATISGQSCRPDDPFSSTDNPTAAEMAGKQPAAIMADSLNVLSNNCVDANNILDCGGGGQAATSTSIYSALLAGVDITNSTSYNGGLENYPRFHENWSGGPSLTYRGSFVGLDIPQHVSGFWKNQSYSPPTRLWQYDIDFNSISDIASTPQKEGLPPLTPRVAYLSQELFSRDFER
jgi:hypothetical protein